MVSIEYSPNSRARCQQCRGKISAGSVRVVAKGAPVSNSSGWINKFTHAECYTHRKDLTQLYGFHTLAAEDRKRFMSEEQRRAEFPGDYVGEAVAAAAAGPATGLQKRDPNASEPKEEPAKKKAKKAQVHVLGIVGLKYAEARAGPGEVVTLVREPENQYDSNAIKVLNGVNRLVGRINKEHAAPISQQLDNANANLQKRGEKMILQGKVLDVGDGYKQSVEVEFKKIVVDPQLAEKVNKAAAASSTGKQALATGTVA